MPCRLHPALRTALRGCARWAVALGTLASVQASPNEVYDLRPLVDPDTPREMRRCLGPDADSAALRDFVARALSGPDPSSGAQFGGEGARGVILAAGGQWACVRLSPQGFPLWPVEAMHGLIVPVGVPAELTLRWRREMLEQVALDGVGRGLIVYPSGDADQVLVIAEQRQALHVRFTRRLLRAGEFREQSYPAVLRHPGLTRLVTRSMGPGDGTPKRLAIPPQRLMKPVLDGFVQVEATEPTRGFPFAGTRWIAPGTSLQIDFRAGGQAIRSADGSVERGTWQVVDGVLRVTLAGGARYALALRSDGITLAGMARRAEADSHDDEGDEWQWSTQLRMKDAVDEGRAGRKEAARRGVALQRACG